MDNGFHLSHAAYHLDAWGHRLVGEALTVFIARRLSLMNRLSSAEMELGK